MLFQLAEGGDDDLKLNVEDSTLEGSLMLNTSTVRHSVVESEVGTTPLMLLPVDTGPSSLLISTYDHIPLESHLVDSIGDVQAPATLENVQEVQETEVEKVKKVKNTPQLPCGECGKVFSTLKARGQHERLVHNKVINDLMHI